MDKPFALIIEDERDIAALFRHVLDISGFQTEIVLHGQTAIERLSRCQPDVVLLDLNLPGVSGVEILKWIRKERRLHQVKVVVITGNAHAVGGLTDQPDLVLLKPVSVDQLSALIKRISLPESAPKAVPLQQRPLDKRTGLYNQSFFVNRLESSLRRSRDADPNLFAVLLFKPEPRHKRDASPTPHEWESVLQELAASLRGMLRPTDTIARFDPDTFYILIENVPDAEILPQIANRIQERLYREIADIGDKIRIPVRIGILLCDREYETAEMILGDAQYAQVLAIAQGDEYSKYYYRVSTKKKTA